MEIIFKDRIRALRQERGETQVQVAEAIGVAESHYQRFERGANLPNLENAWKLADHFWGHHRLSGGAQRQAGMT